MELVKRVIYTKLPYTRTWRL